MVKIHIRPMMMSKHWQQPRRHQSKPPHPYTITKNTSKLMMKRQVSYDHQIRRRRPPLRFESLRQNIFSGCILKWEHSFYLDRFEYIQRNESFSPSPLSLSLYLYLKFASLIEFPIHFHFVFNFYSLCYGIFALFSYAYHFCTSIWNLWI